MSRQQGSQSSVGESHQLLLDETTTHEQLEQREEKKYDTENWTNLQNHLLFQFQRPYETKANEWTIIINGCAIWEQKWKKHCTVQIIHSS